MNKQQILCVYCFVDEDYSVISEEIDDFAFCGYDLADHHGISTLTNCGGFDEVFTGGDLNSLGLISNYQTARKIQADLKCKYHNEEHADCLLFAVWRRTLFYGGTT